MTNVAKTELFVNIKRISYQQIILISLKGAAIADWCAKLCLLKEGLVNELVIIGAAKVTVQIDPNIERETRATVRLKGNDAKIKVNPEEYQFWLEFFLKYYRDGRAEVDHIDTEAIMPTSQGEEEIYITFEVQDFKPPMNAAEARRILDQYPD